jgi:hypothetical protein
MKSKNKMKTKTKKPSEGDELLAEVMRYRRGIGCYDFSTLKSDGQRYLAAIEAWKELEPKIEHRLYKVGIKL